MTRKMVGTTHESLRIAAIRAKSTIQNQVPKLAFLLPPRGMYR